MVDHADQQALDLVLTQKGTQHLVEPATILGDDGYHA
jgi:hypothetical protein